MKSIKQKGKSDKIKRGSRRRSSSTESSDLFGDIPRPSQTDRSRSVEITGGIARIELERSKTDSVTALGYNDGVLDYTSDKDELATSIKPNTERALLAQAAASSTRLMSLSLGRGQPIPSPAQAASTLTAAESQSLPSGRSDVSTGRAEGEEDPPSEQPSIESYIGQSFPLVKNIDKTVVESVTKYDVSQPYRFQGSQPQPASVISDHDYNYVQTTPPYDQKGKRSHRQKKAFKSSSIDTAGLIAAASESTKPLLYSDVRGSIVTPPRKVGTLQDGFDHQSPALKSAATSRSSSPMVDSDRLQQSLSRSGGQSRLRDVSVVSSGASCVPVQVSVLATTTSTNAAPAGPTGSRNSRAVGNDSTLQQRLQEAKALSRKDDGSNGGAVMHKFSLWKGVEKRAPLVDPPKTAGNGEAGNVGLGPVDSGGVRKHSTDSASSGTADVAPPKKSSRVKKGVPSARQSSEEAIEATTPPVRLAKLKHRKAPKPAHNFPPDNYSSSTKSKCRVKIGAVVQSEADFEVASDGSIDEVSSEDESNALAMTSGGRASAFRNMVGICKTHNSSTGSLTESVKTELGSIMVHATETSNSVDTVQYSDDEEFEYIGFEDPEPAILGIAVEECSMLSEEGDGDYIDKLVEDDEDMKPIDMTREKLKNHILSPESSSSSLAYSHSHDGSVCNTAAKYKKDIRIDSIEAVEQVSRVAAFSPVVEISPSEPPPLRKGEKTMPLFNMDPLATQAAVGMSGEASSSVSLSRLPTERRSTSSRQKQADKSETNPVEKHSAQTNGRRHKVKSRGPERIGKDEKEKNDPLNSSVHKRDDGSLSPALSEVSDMEPDKEDTQPFSIAITKAAPPRTLITHATKQPEEIFTIKDFQWKKGSEIIGEGTFGQVYKGLNCSTGELLAVKQISLTDGTEEEVQTLRKEIDLMQDLVHPNIVRYLYIVFTYLHAVSFLFDHSYLFVATVLQICRDFCVFEISVHCVGVCARWMCCRHVVSVWCFLRDFNTVIQLIDDHHS